MKFAAAMLVAFTALTAAMTWPQVLHLRDRVHDDGDPLLNAWALAWVAHQLPRAPGHIFDANIFYPERRTLAYSETLLLPGAVAAPLHWAGVGPLAVYNLVFLSGFIISGVGVALLVHSLTGSAGAGFVGGIVFAFLPYRIDHFPHLQLQQTQCLPFAMWAFHRLLRTGRLRDGAMFGAFAAGQALSCMYYGLFLLPYMAVVCGTLLVGAWSRLQVKRTLTALAVGGVVATAVVAPVAKAYFDARKVVGERGRDEVWKGSAQWWNYLAPAEANLVYGKVFARYMDAERRLFPGFAAVALAAAALFVARKRESTNALRDRSVVLAYFLSLVVAFDVSLGFNGLTFTALYDHFVPFRALRIPARMGMFTGFSLAVLAGIGAARIGGRWQSAGRRRLFFATAAALMLLEYASKPIQLAAVPTEPPQAYADIIRDRGDSPTAVLFEFPPAPADDPMWMYYSTFHWQYLVNGYSGFFPPSYRRFFEAVQNFPDRAAFTVMRQHGTRYLVVHGERLYGGRYEQLVPQLDAHPELALVSRRPWYAQDKHAEISVYRLKPEP